LTQPCGGILGASVRLAGTPKTPDVSGAMHVKNLSLSGQSYGGAELTLATEERLVVRGTLGQAPLGPLDLAARVPLAGGWPVPSLNQQGKLDATVTGSETSSSPASARSPKRAVAARREADLQVTVTGTPASPHLAGGLTASGVRLGLVATGTTWQEDACASASPTRAARRRAVVRRRPRRHAVGLGALALAGDEKNLDLRSRWPRSRCSPASRWTPTRAASCASAAASPARASSATCASTRRPSVRRCCGRRRPPPDPTITVSTRTSRPTGADADRREALAKVPASNPSPHEKAAAQAQPAFIDRVAMAVTLTLGEPVVVQRVDAYVRLSGQVYVTKEPADPLRISGQIAGERGWYMFRGRRIVLQSAFVSFSDETPIDPYLTVTATYQLPDYIVTVRSGHGARPEARAAERSAADQSDVLALLFGKTTSQLTGGRGI
jgi:autotransporter translocation and assembly factor TamB